MATKLLLIALCLFQVILASNNEDWSLVRQADDDGLTVTFRVALKHQNVHKLEALLMAVSDPTSPLYGKHATKEEVSALVSPPKHEVEAVTQWFMKHSKVSGDVVIKPYDDALHVTTSIEYVSRVFGAKFHWYTHGPTQQSVVRSDENGIIIPSELYKQIEFITGLVTFPIIPKELSRKRAAAAATAAGTYRYVSPTNIRALYSIPATSNATNSKSSQCAMEFLPEGGFSAKDLQEFCKQSNEAYTPFSQIVGKNSGVGGESELDVQLLATIGSGATNWFWTVKDGWIYDMAIELFNHSSRPWVVSISYGWPEIFTCPSSVLRTKCTDNQVYLNRTNTELAKLGALGLTFLVSSGDTGAPSNFNANCQNTTHPVFANYPCSSPYVTSVSATALGPDLTAGSTTPPICKSHPCDNSSTHEAATMPSNTLFGWTTGGGFSELTTRPSYQDAAVSAFLKVQGSTPPDKYFWPANRGYPDISALGARILIVSGGVVASEEGTSASAPIIAGIVTLLNDQRFNSNKAALGFLNPLLYKMAADQPNTFQDIIEGDNARTDAYTKGCYGYQTTKGWDAVTGLGTPNFANMAKYIANLS